MYTVSGRLSKVAGDCNLVKMLVNIFPGLHDVRIHHEIFMKTPTKASKPDTQFDILPRDDTVMDVLPVFCFFVCTSSRVMEDLELVH